MLRTDAIRAVLLDIEGTTSPVQFVYEVLFPYARDRVSQFLKNNWNRDEVASALQSLAADNITDIKHGAPAIRGIEGPEFLSSIAGYCLWLISQDRKSTALKAIQGLIWEQGFRSGELHGQVFADVPVALRKWHDENRLIAIYSSGSVLAQQLLFSHSQWGDLTRYITYFYDTRIGAKRDVASYRRIAADMQCEPAHCIFLSDVVEELDAAGAAAIRTALVVRDNHSIPIQRSQHSVISSFDELVFE